MARMTPTSERHRQDPLQRPSHAWSRAWVAPVLLLLTACGTTQFEAQTVIPPPLITQIPVVVGVHITPEFRDQVHREERDGGDVEIAVGKAQTAGFLRLLTAMFTRVVQVPSVAGGAAIDPQMRGVLEPVLEEFSFITPSDTGTSLYAVSLKYRVNAYRPSGELIDSWTFTGYGAEPSLGLPTQGKPALQRATALAMRDAGTKLAVEFREQAIVRGLIEAGAPATVAPELQPVP
jgi:hypothetical protein